MCTYGHEAMVALWKVHDLCLRSSLGDSQRSSSHKYPERTWTALYGFSWISDFITMICNFLLITLPRIENELYNYIFIICITRILFLKSPLPISLAIANYYHLLDMRFKNYCLKLKWYLNVMQSAKVGLTWGIRLLSKKEKYGISFCILH